MKIIAEVEDTKVGTIAVVKNDDGTFSVGYMVEDIFEAKHPNTDAVGAINALAHYFNGEIYAMKKQKK